MSEYNIDCSGLCNEEGYPLCYGRDVSCSDGYFQGKGSCVCYALARRSEWLRERKKTKKMYVKRCQSKRFYDKNKSQILARRKELRRAKKSHIAQLVAPPVFPNVVSGDINVEV